MTRRNSLAERMSNTLIVWMGAIWLISVLAVTWYVDHEINRNFDDELVEVSHRMFDIALHDLYAAPIDGAERVASPPLFLDDAVNFHLLEEGGRVLLRSAISPPRTFGVPLQPGFANIGPLRIYTLRHPRQPMYLQLADPLEERRNAVNRTLVGLVVPMIAVLPLLAFLLRRIARQQLRMVSLIEGEIAGRSGHDLRPIEIDGLPSELQSVVLHVNHLLQRLALSLDVERALAANTAHELRTPLASARLRLQTALDHGLAREDVQAALDAMSSLGRRTEKLLQLSRAESGTTLQQEAVDLATLARIVVDEFKERGGVGERLQLHAAVKGTAVTKGDINTLGIALRNLIENALHYSQGAMVTVEVQAPAMLTVRDAGPGVAPDQLQVLAHRHVRKSSSGAGYGLGLSIVTTIVEKHGGTLVLRSPPMGQATGFEAQLVLVPAG